MDEVRIGVIGQGGMGRQHTKYLVEGKVPRARVTAVCDLNADLLKDVESRWGAQVKAFTSLEELFGSGLVDGVLIAVPHYFHPGIAIQAFQRGMHVLLEKPAGVFTKNVREMNEAAARSGKTFGIMFQMRTNPVNQKLRELVQGGAIGRMLRTQMIGTHWFRAQSYYDMAGWRGTWKGEGGGVLINQAPHDLDIWQWICGLPRRVRAFCGFGKHHRIEVEDEVTAYVEYEGGATGTFIVSTGEVPGEERLVIAGDNGTLKCEKGKITRWTPEMPIPRFNQEWKKGFGSPKCVESVVEVSGKPAGHEGLTANWVQAILEGSPLLAPGEEGLRSLELSNAMHLSTWLDDWVSLPVDGDLFLEHLNARIEKKAQA